MMSPDQSDQTEQGEARSLAIFDGPGWPAPVPEPLTDPVYAYVDSLSPASQEAVWKRLCTVARLFEITDPATFPWHHLRAAQIARIRQRLMQPYGPANKRAAPATVNLTLAVFRGIAREARNANALTDEEYRRICEVKADKGERLPRGRAVPTGELTALVKACAWDTSPAGVRDAAMLACLYTGGLRRSELAVLTVEDYTPAPPALRVLHGKNDKQRAVPIPASAAAALDRWLELRGREPGALFVPKVQGLDVGAVDYITKPFDLVEVLARLRTAIMESQRRRSLMTEVAELRRLVGDRRKPLVPRLRIFVASPSDVQEERKALGTVVEELNRTIGREKDVMLDLVRWETDIVPDMGPPQDVINRQIERIGPYDIFVGIMWRRFGTPTEHAASGTQEEFQSAYETYTKTGRPRIMFYFKQAAAMPTTVHEAQQVVQVLTFRDELGKKGLYTTYGTVFDFERYVREHLTKRIGELLEG